MNIVQAIGIMGAIRFSSPAHAKLYVKSVKAFSRDDSNRAFLDLPNTDERCDAATFIAANFDDYKDLHPILTKGKRR